MFSSPLFSRVRRNALGLTLLPAALLTAVTLTAHAETAKEITQYGITWTFDKPHEVGKFVTGDYWVVGPVTVVSVSPTPGKADEAHAGVEHKSIYGATGMKPDTAMRNGSMLNPAPGGKQGYDSRLVNYDPALSAAFPCNLAANQSLVSTISYDGPPVPVLLAPIMWASEKNAALALKSAAILTLSRQGPTRRRVPPALHRRGQADFRDEGHPVGHAAKAGRAERRAGAIVGNVRAVFPTPLAGPPAKLALAANRAD